MLPFFVVSCLGQAGAGGKQMLSMLLQQFLRLTGMSALQHRGPTSDRQVLEQAVALSRSPSAGASYLPAALRSQHWAAVKGALENRKVLKGPRFQCNASMKSMERDDNTQLQLS